jgi:hypothetical protein
MCGHVRVLQVNMQALVLVSLFRQQTRARIIEAIEWCLPDRIPWVRSAAHLNRLPRTRACLVLLAPASSMYARRVGHRDNLSAA